MKFLVGAEGILLPGMALSVVLVQRLLCVRGELTVLTLKLDSWFQDPYCVRTSTKTCELAPNSSKNVM